MRRTEWAGVRGGTFWRRWMGTGFEHPEVRRGGGPWSGDSRKIRGLGPVGGDPGWKLRILTGELREPRVELSQAVRGSPVCSTGSG